jgi:Rab GDP dissociation inhibitor
MDEEYDVIVLGTGLKECILSGLLSVSGKKVLHLDRNDYYGADSASLNLKQLFAKFEPPLPKAAAGDDATSAMAEVDEKKEAVIDEETLGRSKDYSLDLCPKFIMGCGDLVKMLLHTKVTRYLEFRHVDGSYVYQEGALYEVPMTTTAALASSLMGWMQKRRYKGFLSWVLDCDTEDSTTWGRCDLDTQTMRDIYKYWKISDSTMGFTGHAVALYTDDDYLDDVLQTKACVDRLKLYAYSLARFEKSPYIYPVWGLGGLPEGFSRLAAVHGGVYMLRREVDEILYDEKGAVTGVKVSTEGKPEGTATCKQLIADPSYFVDTDKVKRTGQVARWLCILDHPVEGTTESSGGAQVILPFSQTGHRSDIYISVMGSDLKVAPEGRWIAMISAQVYTTNPKRELAVAFRLLGKTLKDFFYVTDTYVADNAEVADNVFICSSMDATTHFQHATKEVMAVYEAITGEPVNLDADASVVGTDAQYE